MEKVFNHPQTEARDLVQDVDFEAAKSGRLALLGPAVKFSHTKAAIRSRPPLHGEHTDEVLAEFGIDEAQTKELRDAGVLK